VLVVGSAGGTVAREFFFAFNSSVDAVEIDGELVELGYRYLLASPERSMCSLRMAGGS